MAITPIGQNIIALGAQISATKTMAQGSVKLIDSAPKISGNNSADSNSNPSQNAMNQDYGMYDAMKQAAVKLPLAKLAGNILNKTT